MRQYTNVPVYVKNRAGEVVEKSMRWGFIPWNWTGRLKDWTYSSTHARLETVADDDKCFGRAWRLGRRAIFPVGEVFEKGWAISRRDGGPMAVAGVYDYAMTADGPVLSIAMLTREPDAWMRKIHDREAVILNLPMAAQWLNGADDLDLTRPLSQDVYQAVPEAEWRLRSKRQKAGQLDILAAE